MESSLLNKLLAITSLFQQDMARAFEGTPLTESRVAVLWTLSTSGPSTQQVLSSALSVTPKNISGLVDVLEKHGYARRVPHPSDRRAVLVELTDAGEAMMTRMQEEHASLEAELLDAIPPERRAEFENGIDAIIARLTELMSAAQSDSGSGT
ncbi:MarR family winged helix-turn-helix transcriptional regulator [Brevibacterium marinum]|uniref:DNA-binding MarR family transcriptional regulator n=1 Tax=Brevibacterium marinum TaxID=418643 RepID=A0A846S7E5_9MICO|nr:MarR family transcriptional regulator [Brevibacterium marinum]NJC56747.1 DNA-binding MarR family transcriptional regulator [Brevibacterium marinum]